MNVSVEQLCIGLNRDSSHVKDLPISESELRNLHRRTVHGDNTKTKNIYLIRTSLALDSFPFCRLPSSSLEMYGFTSVVT